MTYPGVTGGPGWLSTTGFSIRQYRHIGVSAGLTGTSSVLGTMGAYAPPLGVLAGTVTEMQEYAASPNPIAQENFELNYAQTGYTGVDTGLPQDYTGSGSAVTAESEFPHQLPYTYQK